jgi:putative FmdB family regulatory protein
MPTYEYTCRDCGHTFDIVQSMWDDALTMCPECGGSLRKVFAPPAISFKGSGFYATDHGKKSKVSNSSGEKGDKAEKGDKGEKGSSEKKNGGSDGSPSASSTTTKKEPAAS